ncbi:MAG: proton-conducting transporter membrane subunit, partial [Calditrichia bacterium]
RIHTRDIAQMGGLWENVPRMGGVGMLFAMASLGLPGLGNFIAEFLTLVGSFQTSVWITILATLGLVAATVYSLRIVQRVFHGKKEKEWSLPDLGVREMIIMGAMIIVIVWFGLYPQPIFDTARPALEKVEENAIISVVPDRPLYKIHSIEENQLIIKNIDDHNRNSNLNEIGNPAANQKTFERGITGGQL